MFNLAYTETADIAGEPRKFRGLASHYLPDAVKPTNTSDPLTRQNKSIRYSGFSTRLSRFVR